MRVLLTGSGGFLGRHLISGLASGGIEGIAVSRTQVSVLPEGWIAATRNKVLSGASAFAPDLVIHLEVKQHLMRVGQADLDDFRNVNILGTKQWLDWCTLNSVERFVYFSSIKAVRPYILRATDEEASGPPESPYGSSKWEAERLVQSWTAARLGRKALILRPAVIYGQGNSANMGAMVEAIRRGHFFLVGRNENIKSIVSSVNVVAATRYLINHMKKGCEVYNITDAESLSVREIDRRIRARLGKSGNSTTLWFSVARTLARIGDIIYSVTGRTLPFNSSRLAAMLETSNFTCKKLLSTGFRHPAATLAEPL